MKVAMVRQKFPLDGGVESHVSSISGLLTSKGVGVEIYTSDVDIDWRRLSVGVEVVNGINVKRHRSLGRVFRNLIIPSLLPSLLTSDVDIIHIHGHFYNSTELSFLAAKLKRKPLVITPHLQPPAAYPPGVERRIRYVYERSIDRIIFNRADKIITVSPYSENYLKSHVDLDPRKVVVIPNGLDHHRFDCIRDPRGFRSKWSISGKLILYVGHLSARKGLSYLVRALPEVLRHYPKLKLLLVGPDRGRLGALRTIARKENMENSVVFTGYLPEAELADAYSAADVFVLPSLHEAFGMVLLEAMGFGVPVVATASGGIPFVVENERDGLLVKPSSHELAEAILRVLGDKDLGETLRANGLKKAYSWPSWDEVADRILMVYQSLK